MSTKIPGLGSLADVPQLVENASLTGLQLTSEDWYLLSRIDGSITLQDVFFLSPRPQEETISILKRLHHAHLITLPGIDTVQEPRSATGEGKNQSFEIPQSWPNPIEKFPFDPKTLQLNVGIDLELKKHIIYVHAQLHLLTYYQLFDVASNASAREIRRRYFRYSKIFHPDRFFRQDIGIYRPLLEEIFRWVNDAHQTLIDPEKRKEYDAILASGSVGAWNMLPAPVTKQHRTLRQILADAKNAEQAKDYAGALRLYEEALEQQHPAELLHRAAECMILLRRTPHRAEMYLREAIQLNSNNARFWNTLAHLLEHQGRHDEAITHYQQVVLLAPEHQVAKVRLQQLQQR